MKLFIISLLICGGLHADVMPAWYILLHGTALGYTTAELDKIADDCKVIQKAAMPVVSVMANITVTLKPLNLKSTRLVYNNSQVGIWTVAIKNNSAYNLNDIDRNTIMAEFPEIPDIPNTLAQDILTRDTNRSFWSIAKVYLQEILNIGPAGLTAAGLATNNKSLGYWGLGASVISYLISRSSTRSPNPTPYFSNLFPDSVSIAAGHASPTYYLVTPLISKVQSVKLSLDIPVL